MCPEGEGEGEPTPRDVTVITLCLVSLNLWTLLWTFDCSVDTPGSCIFMVSENLSLDLCVGKWASFWGIHFWFVFFLVSV